MGPVWFPDGFFSQQPLDNCFFQPFFPSINYTRSFLCFFTPPNFPWFLMKLTPRTPLILEFSSLRHALTMAPDDDDDEIIIPESVCFQAAQATRFSIIARPCNPRRQNIRSMMRFLPRLWGMDDVVFGRLVPNNRVQFVFPSQESMDLVTRRGPWSFNEWMVAMGPWEEGFPDDYPTAVAFWLQIRDIPLQFYTHSIVSFIADKMGHVVETDFNLDRAADRDYARARIAWPMTEALTFHRRFRFGGHAGVPISFRYERLRNYCYRCLSLCHDISECDEPEKEYRVNPPGTDHDDVPMSDPTAIIPSGGRSVSLTPRSGPALPGPASPLLLADSASSSRTVSDFVSLQGHRISPSLFQEIYHKYTSMAPTAGEIHATTTGPDVSGKGKGVILAESADSLLEVEASRYTAAKRKRLEREESIGECSSNNAQFGGAAGPVPPPLQ